MTDVGTHIHHEADNSDVEALQKKSSEQLRREIRQLQKENNSLSRRLLGVNELARLLQEKSEKCETLQDRNQRLELALVRLENRCSNFEKKLMSQQFSSLPSDVSNTTPTSISSNRTGGGGQQSPFIPGPSRQILEQLMKDNTDLKNTINGLTKKGPKGFMEAVVSFGIALMYVHVCTCMCMYMCVYVCMYLHNMHVHTSTTCTLSQ